MSCCVIFGGAGYIGTHLARHFLQTGRFSRIHIADLRPSELNGTPGITTSITDVREQIPLSLVPTMPTWIFNLAAIHREPGHVREEYFKTNLEGARNVCNFANATGCKNLYFTSSISVYGPTCGPTTEHAPIQPSTPYGSSKYAAELIHEIWFRQTTGSRLFICRPGVIYGPGDPGNILRMIKAIRKGYFAFPGSANIYKSYGYIYGMLNGIDFVMDSDENFFCYNYVETPTQPLGELVAETQTYLKSRALVLPIPQWVLLPLARLVQALVGSRNPVHPVRVKKVATATHIVPQSLIDRGFPFAYSFRESLKHWANHCPQDFGLPARSLVTAPRVVLNRAAESRIIPIAESTTPPKRAVGVE
jgi:nucleoside-diphosphate-sugar epimerase